MVGTNAGPRTVGEITQLGVPDGVRVVLALRSVSVIVVDGLLEGIPMCYLRTFVNVTDK
jgi:hypothetical protein